MARTRLFTVTPLLSLVALAACTSIIGIEDLHDGPRPGSEANGGDGTGNTGATDNTGNTGATSNGGSVSAGSPATGGNGGDSNVPNGGAGNEGNGAGQGPIGEGGAPNPVDGTVKGKVIDFWGRPIPNLPVQIGNELTTTDAKGAFTVADVPATYDVSMAFTHNDRDQVDAWVYQGLTRRDPTLQMFFGADEDRYGYAAYTFNPKPTLAATETISVGFGGVDGNYLHDDVSVDGTTGSEVDWNGPETVLQNFHALRWTQDVNKLPVAYTGYGTGSAMLTEYETNAPSVTIPFAKANIPTAFLEGTVTSTGAGTRYNQVYLGFKDNARIKLLDDDGPDAFKYVVPNTANVANSDISVAALRGYQYSGFAVAHADIVAAGAKPALKIPPLVVQLTPAAGAKNVDQTTKFSLKDPGGNPGPYLLMFYSQKPSDPNAVQAFQCIYVVTAATQLTIPTIIGGGLAMYPGNDYLWSVATFGAFPSVDAMLEPKGFIDEFAYDERDAYGPHRVSGEYSNTDVRRFTTKP